MKHPGLGYRNRFSNPTSEDPERLIQWDEQEWEPIAQDKIWKLCDLFRSREMEFAHVDVFPTTIDN